MHSTADYAFFPPGLYLGEVSEFMEEGTNKDSEAFCWL